MADPAYIVDGVLTDGEAWVGIATTTLGSDTATVTFTSTDDGQVGDFSQYMDLVLVSYVRSAQAVTSDGMRVNLNNDTNNNYSIQWFYGNGSTASASSGSTYSYFSGGDLVGDSAGANIFSSAVLHLFDINSGKYKTGFVRVASDRNGAGYVQLNASTWRSQAAITEIDLLFSGTNIKSGSRFDLFGVLPRMVS